MKRKNMMVKSIHIIHNGCLYLWKQPFSLCFLSSEDLKITGVCAFIIYSTDAFQQDMSIFWKIYDESNTNMLSDGDLRESKLFHELFKPDNTKVI